MAAITDYKLLSTEEEGVEKTASCGEDDWKTYPALRRNLPLQDAGPPEGMVFIRTGGNALQAVNRDVIENRNMISVIVPEGKEPGDEILVVCPFIKDRLISVVIPKNATAGSAFLVQAPPTSPEIVTGVPVEPSLLFGEDVETPVVNGLDIFAQDELALREEETNGSEERYTNQQTTIVKDPDEEDYEMVGRDRLV